MVSAQQTFQHFPRNAVRTRAAAPSTIEDRMQAQAIGSLIAARVEAGGQQHIGSHGDHPAAMLAPAAAAGAGCSTPYTTDAGYATIPLRPEYTIHDSMTGREIRGVTAAAGQYFGLLKADNTAAQLWGPSLRSPLKLSFTRKPCKNQDCCSHLYIQPAKIEDCIEERCRKAVLIRVIFVDASSNLEAVTPTEPGKKEAWVCLSHSPKPQHYQHTVKTVPKS